MNWTLPAILRATGGELVQWGAGPFAGITTDIADGEPEARCSSRSRGDRTTAHEFLPKGVAQGATGVIVSRPGARGARRRVDARRRGTPRRSATSPPRAVVSFARASSASPAATARRRPRRCSPRCSARVGREGRAHAGTENNLVGLPLTLLRLDGDERFVVLEMGMNRPGEIWRLAEIARAGRRRHHERRSGASRGARLDRERRGREGRARARDRPRTRRSS